MTTPRTEAGRNLSEALHAVGMFGAGNIRVIEDEAARMERERIAELPLAEVVSNAYHAHKDQGYPSTVDALAFTIARAVRRAITDTGEEAARVGFCGSCGTPGFYAGDRKHPCIPPRDTGEEAAP
jgi:hypothetical protein